MVFALFIISCKKNNNNSDKNSTQEVMQASINGNVLNCYNKDYAIYKVNSHLTDAIFYKGQMTDCEKNAFELAIPDFNIDSAYNCFNHSFPFPKTLPNAIVRFRNEVNDSLFRDYYLYSGVNANITIDFITSDDLIAGHFTGKFYTREYLQVCGPIIPVNNPILDSLEVTSGTYIIKLQRE
ncbi:MAG: hypothetical protein ABR968_09280 [Bacteroidales bacterium]|jgi:hypothetical protein